MAADVQPIAQIKLPARPSSLTPEQTYWHSFKSPAKPLPLSNNAITHISQPTVANGAQRPDSFVVTTGAKVQIYSTGLKKPPKTIARFSDTAYSGELRYDGRVLAAGEESGVLQIFDAASRAILKTWKEQKQAVHCVRWSPRESTTLMSGCDDTTVRLWDLPSEASQVTFRGHQDYVRCGAFLPNQTSNLLVSGSYDQTVRIWDPRTSSAAVMTFKHVGAVEDVLCMPAGNSLLAAADNQVAVLDLVAGRPLHMIKNHQKTITSLTLASRGSRLITGGLDGFVKVFETTGWNVAASTKYPSPILSLGVISSGATNEDKHIAVGMSSGELSIKTRLSGEQKVKERERQKEMEALLAGKIEEYDRKQAKKRGRGWEKQLRGRDHQGEDADIIVEGNDRRRAKKLKLWETALHKGKYVQALDIVLAGKDRMTIFTLLNNLRYRSALRTALQGRSETTIRPILEWVSKNVSNPTFTKVCVEVSMNLLDIYSGDLDISPTLLKQTEKLHRRILGDVEIAKQASCTKGMLQLLSPDLGT